MYKKLLTENGKSGGMASLLSSIKRENFKWKVVSFFAIIVALFVLIGGKFNNDIEAIATKNISYLSKDIIAEVRVDGAIMPDIEREIMFEEIYKSTKIKGLLVVINSPGGAPAASEILYWQLKKIGEKIPVIAFVEDLAASGGYMVAIGANKIVALRTSVVGSIGIRGFAKFDLTGIMKKYDVGYEEYASSEYKTSSSNFVKTTEKERAYLRETLLQGYDVFKDMVSKERNLKGNELERVANAKIFFAEKALEYKLIDSIGTKDSAIELINGLVKSESKKSLQVKMIKPEPKPVDGFFGNVSKSLINIFGFVEKQVVNNSAQVEL